MSYVIYLEVARRGSELKKKKKKPHKSIVPKIVGHPHARGAAGSALPTLGLVYEPQLHKNFIRDSIEEMSFANFLLFP